MTFSKIEMVHRSKQSKSRRDKMDVNEVGALIKRKRIEKNYTQK